MLNHKLSILDVCLTKLESDDHLVIISVNDSVNDDSEAEMLRRSLSLLCLL